MQGNDDSGKTLYFKEMNGEQRRQMIDTQQVFEAWRAARLERDRRFKGGMRWGKRNGAEYLLRKAGRGESSLGRRSADTEASYEAFKQGQKANAERLGHLAQRLDELAPINRAMGLGRMPVLGARILRRCDEAGLLGEHLFVVGTNALFAYEAVAGVIVESGLLATGDIDLLYDARRSLTLAVEGVRQEGLIGLLRRVDESFAPLRPRSFRATNQDGYMVDLIRPEPKDVFRDRRRAAMSDLPDDLEGAAIFGLDWLINAPKIEAVPLDERGYPVLVVAIDPRAFALHKAWLSRRPDREPLKAKRDIEQAKAAAVVVQRYLGQSFDAPTLAALPAAMRKLASEILPEGPASPVSGKPRR